MDTQRRENMRTRTLVLLLALLVTACVPQVKVETLTTPTAFVPATQPPTVIAPSDTPFVPTATEPLPTETATLAIAPTSAANTATSLPPVTGVHNPYAVLLVAKDDVLNIRSGAGVSNAVVGTLQPRATNVSRTGPASTAAGDRWVEIQNPNGGTGWVNANFLTEYVASSAFCADTRVPSLINTLKTALLNSDGALLSSLVSPAHGLDLRLWRYGTSANYSPEEAGWVFLSDYVVEWGDAPGSGAPTPGTFRQQPLPRLTEVFGANYTLHCNDTLDLATFSLDPWPPEYANVNFYTVYKPGTEQYGGLDWRAWIVGVEYVGGAPKLFALIHFQWEP
jgi:uncharacterized protein YgiM (DUF1202 family)